MPKQLPHTKALQTSKRQQFLDLLLSGKCLTVTDAYIQVYEYTGSRKQAQKNASATLKESVRNKDITQNRKGSVSMTPEQFKTALQQEGVDMSAVAKRLKYLLYDAGKAKNKKANPWPIVKSLEMVCRIFGWYAPEKKEISHTIAASRLDVVKAIFRMLENPRLREMVKKAVRVFDSGGKPQDVIEADYTIEDEK